MNINSVTTVYNNYASFYNIIFGKVLDSGRRKSIKLMNPKNGDKIIEFGIGTGLSLNSFPKNVTLDLTGIDLSDKMLSKAKLQGQKFKNIHLKLYKMDAENTTFSDNTFDKVALMYIYSVTPNPEKLLKEALRICKENGDVFIVNHFSNSKNDKLSLLEKMVKSFSNTIGFRSDFSYQKYIKDLNINIENVTTANIFSLTKIIHFKKKNNLHLIE